MVGIKEYNSGKTNGGFKMKLIMRAMQKIVLTVLWMMPKASAHKILYFLRMKKRLNLKNPKDFNEKIHWIIVNENPKKYARFADKLLVRDYIAEKGYLNLLPKIYLLWGGQMRFKDIDFSSLPNQFVLKTNHGSGSVFICTDKKTFAFKEAEKILTKLLHKNYAKRALEYHYTYIKPRIMCEEYLKEEGMKNPLDYKIHCFSGKPDCIELCSDREHDVKLDFYDLNWNYLPYATEKYKSDKLYPRPENLEEMLKIAEDLSKDFLYVRVDLYNINGRIYFGELTLTSAAGFHPNLTQEALDYLGSKIHLPFEK